MEDAAKKVEKLRGKKLVNSLKVVIVTTQEGIAHPELSRPWTISKSKKIQKTPESTFLSIRLFLQKLRVV